MLPDTISLALAICAGKLLYELQTMDKAQR